jgi:adenylate cyclase
MPLADRLKRVYRRPMATLPSSEYSEPQAVRINSRHVDLQRGVISYGGVDTALRPQSLAVLRLLLGSAGALVTKEALMTGVWPGVAVTDDSLVQCITEIRRALGDDEHVIVKTVPKRGYALEAALKQPRASPEPAIAVLPFANMSGDPAQDHFGRAVADDIITVLSRYPTLRVVSRMSSFVYDKPVRVQDVGRALQADYVMEGSVRKADGRLRVSVQLIDAASGAHVWADRFDEGGGDIAAQETIGTRIYNVVAGLRGQIRRNEHAQAWAKPDAALEEYDHYLRGDRLFFRFSREHNLKAREVYAQGLAKFPGSTLLRIMIAWTHLNMLELGWSDDPGADADAAWEFGTAARAAQNKSPLETFLSRWQMAVLHYFCQGDFESAASGARAAVKLVPFDPYTRAYLSYFLIGAGHAGEARKWLEESIPRDIAPLNFYFEHLGLAHYIEGHPELALETFKRMPSPWNQPRMILRAACLARAGRLDEARSEVAAHLKRYPCWTIAKEAVWPTGRAPKFAEPMLSAYLDDLRKAGLPEG